METGDRTATYDVAVIGGGVNGCGIARDLAGRGQTVLLAEARDLASGTSSASTKLIHGGLRYLEHYEFALVRESLKEREVLLRLAPHIVRPMRFVLPHHAGLRPALLIRLGLFLYDVLGGRKLLAGSRSLDLTRDSAGEPLQEQYVRGFEYSDCWVDDARLVALNAVDAAAHGADVRVGWAVTAAARDGDAWQLTLRHEESGEESQVRARVLVNAAGPWVGDLARQTLGLNRTAGVRLVKGSHIVVPRLFEHERAYIFQNTDGRVVFAIPYQQSLTLIGTTDVDYDGDPRDAAASADEIAYLCAAVSTYFKAPVRPEDVVWSFSGVRPLQSEEGASAQEVSRDFLLELHGGNDEPALLNVIGGKITTYRHLAVEVAEKLRPHLPGLGPDWTHAAALPGGDMPVNGIAALEAELGRAYPFLEPSTVTRMVAAYGTRVTGILGDATSLADLGRHFGADLYEREVEYLRQHEWARTADDILWRRSKLGLRLTADEVQALADWLSGAEPVRG